MVEKYTDWDESINRKYKIMYSSFGEESGKTKLRNIISNEQVIFKHHKVSDSNYKFTAMDIIVKVYASLMLIFDFKNFNYVIV